MQCVIQPRAKNAGKPVVLTSKALHELQHLPRYAAAATLRISETSLKKACKILGVGNWPCTKRLPRAEKYAERIADRVMESIVESVIEDSVKCASERVAENCAELVAEDCIKHVMELVAQECMERIAEIVVAESEFSPDIFFNNDMF